MITQCVTFSTQHAECKYERASNRTLRDIRSNVKACALLNSWSAVIAIKEQQKESPSWGQGGEEELANHHQ